MTPDIDRTKQEKRKRKRVWWIILACLCLIPVLTTIESRVFHLEAVDFPVSGNVLVFTLINFNVLLLLLVIFLILRNLAQLFFERKSKIAGSRLRTKLVISFISSALIPTALLFFVALQFVSTSMDYWFNINVEESLVDSLTIAKNVYEESRQEARRLGKTTALQLESKRYRQVTGVYLDLFLADILETRNLAGVEILTPQRTAKVRFFGEQTGDEADVPEIPAELFQRSLAGEEDLVTIQEVSAGEMVRSLTQVRLGAGDESLHILITSLLIPVEQLQRMRRISHGLEGYRQLMFLKQPIKSSFLVMLLIVTLLIIFCAIWFGFYIARGLTDPIDKLASATRRVADGELDFVIEEDAEDEMGTLVASFNKMTGDLLVGREQLKASNQELDNRRRYTEIILQNVAAGVISLDETGRITTINRFAEDMLRIDKDLLLGHDYREVLGPDHQQILDGFFVELEQSGKSSIEQPLQLTVRDETFSLRVHVTRLEDEEGGRLGFVLVFDNLTELEKAQRMAAWREVARRIAHEVKNPLTPIQLSAQRLRKRYLEKLASQGEVFDLCTRTIINQVDELKRLVSEFSSFARMPAVNKSMNNLADMVKEVMVLYREGHKNVEFDFQCKEGLPSFSFDYKQMKRVLINLLDNGVAAVGDQGRIVVGIDFDFEQKLVYLEVSDNGPGVCDEDKHHLFEPYFSTKKTGTGLGLAIAGRVISDHGGYIRVKDNEPSGARFIVELPLAG